MFGTVTKQFVLACLVLLATGCTAESTLRSLVEEFSSKVSECNELKDGMFILSDSTRNFSLRSARVLGDKDDFVDFFDNVPLVPYSTAVENTFKLHQDQSIKVQKLVHILGIDYVSVDKERKAVWITLRGGGVLASDKGYLYAGKGDIASFQLKRFLPIPNHANWYAFD